MAQKDSHTECPKSLAIFFVLQPAFEKRTKNGNDFSNILYVKIEKEDNHKKTITGIKIIRI